MIRFFRRATGAAMLIAAALCFAPSAARAQSARAARGGNDVIAGTVISGATGDPLAQADVHLTDVMSGADVAEAVTGSDGRFAFAHLPDGRYDLRASHRGYVTSGYDEHDQMMDTAIVTGAGLDTTGLRLTLPPGAAIYGKVTEDSGDPVPRARITLYAPDLQDGSGRMKRARSVQADEMGNFDAGNLGPGNYYLCASGTPWYAQPPGGAGNAWATSPLNMAYPIGCYPDGAEPAGAAAIAVKGGDRARVNVVLHPVQAVQVTLRVPHPDPRQGMMMPQLQEDVFGIPENIGTESMFNNTGDTQGSYSMAEVREFGIPPGQYQVLLGANPSTGNTARAGSIDVSSGEASLDVSSLPALPGISGSVAMADGGGIPSGLTAALVSGQNEESVDFAQVAADGTFHLDGVRPGKYELAFRGSGAPFAIAAMSATGAAFQGRTIEMGNSAATVLAVVARAKASIYGKVESAGKPAPGVFVLLLPTDPGAGREAWIPNQTDSDGSFLYPYVPPGNYKLVAISQGWALDWARPQAIARYMAKSVDVRVGSASTRIVLKQPLQEQAK
jgi:hypothetical protein